MARRISGTSPPGSTTAAFLVASQIRIVQFCWNGVTGTMATLIRDMRFSEGGRHPSLARPAPPEEGLFARHARPPLRGCERGFAARPGHYANTLLFYKSFSLKMAGSSSEGGGFRGETTCHRLCNLRTTARGLKGICRGDRFHVNFRFILRGFLVFVTSSRRTASGVWARQGNEPIRVSFLRDGPYGDGAGARAFRHHPDDLQEVRSIRCPIRRWAAISRLRPNCSSA